MIKSAFFKPKGMQRDLSMSSFNPEYSYENKNIRIMTTKENTLMSMSNEIGNRQVPIVGIPNGVFQGVPVGVVSAGDDIVVFTTDISSSENYNESTKDRIYVVSFSGEINVYSGDLLYTGNLGFSDQYPIEGIFIHENEDIKKVYWTDGLNPPRVINIAANSDQRDSWNDDSFNFIRKLQLQEDVTVERIDTVGGVFPAGTIQYAFTYFTQYGQESNVFYTSPILYSSYSNRGGSPEDKVSTSFNILIDNSDTNFDYIRVYSIMRTSINATPTCKRVIDLKTTNGSIKYTDTGVNGELIDPTELLYKGGEELIVGTMSHKDSTLFLGDIKIVRPVVNVDDTIRNFFRNGHISFNRKAITVPEPKGYYPYENQLKQGASIKMLKYNEWYRFGIQFQHYTGRWSDPVWINDAKVSANITSTFYNSSNIMVPYATYGFNDATIISYLRSLGFVNYRPVIVYPTINDRECICQGVLCPTVYNVSDRYNNAPFAQSSWFARPNAPFDKSDNRLNYTPFSGSGNEFSRGAITHTTDATHDAVHNMGTQYKKAIKYGEPAEFIHNHPIPGSAHRNAEIQCIWEPPRGPYVTEGTGVDKKLNWVSKYSENYFVDQSIVTLHSPDIEFDSEVQNIDTSHLKLRIVGMVPITANAADIDIETSSSPNPLLPMKQENTDKGEIEEEEEIMEILGGENGRIGSKGEDDGKITGGGSEGSSDAGGSEGSGDTPPSGEDPGGSGSGGSSGGGSGTNPPPSGGGSSGSGSGSNQGSGSNNPYPSYGNLVYPIGFYKEPIGTQHGFGAFGESHFAWRSLISGAFWFDEYSNVWEKQGTDNPVVCESYKAFAVYPWHRTGSLNNTSGNDDTESSNNIGNGSAILKQKKISNAHFSYKTIFFDSSKIWLPPRGISDVQLFNSNEQSLIRLKSPSYSGLPEINYYGNVDKVLTSSPVDENKVMGYRIYHVRSSRMDADYTPHKLFSTSHAEHLTLATANDVKAYIAVDTAHVKQAYSTAPIRITYKSTPHMVIALNYNTDNKQIVLPTISYSGNTQINSAWMGDKDDVFWEHTGNYGGVYQNAIASPSGDVSGVEGIQYGWLWLGELYRDDLGEYLRFGGNTEEAFEANNWLPCGASQPILTSSSLVVNWTEGDTYLQRYDHLKTYPFTPDDINCVTDIISFMCETRVNIDGRYDKNRGQVSNFNMTPTNFNKVNEVYSQKDNFFTTRYIRPDRINLNDFGNIITWTKTKTLGELVDTWTNVTMASVLNLDGDKGKVRAIRRFNNNLIAFQDKGLSQILYNENMQISSTAGVPIEIANSGKVTGKRYISDKLGCTNKWSICETPNGVYFIDDYNIGIYLFNGEITPLSTKFGFQSWIRGKSEWFGFSSWTPCDFGNFVTYYDKKNGDVLFINDDDCLAFSEPLGQFSSFYSYEETPYITNIKDRTVAINTAYNDGTYKLWEQNTGVPNMYFGQYQSYYVDLIVNPNPTTDKIFNTVEFRADSWDEKTNNLLNNTFDTLTVWNEYQHGSCQLTNIFGKSSNLKNKFRIWRAVVPRDDISDSGRDRIRNPWAHIKLSREEQNSNKTILHDVTVHYFE